VNESLDFSSCRLPPFQHQREDVAWLMAHPFALIASEMRTGKSKIVCDAAQFLFERGDVERVIVVAPAPVRDVWYDPQLGEIAKHAWTRVPNRVAEYHARLKWWENEAAVGKDAINQLRWIVTNFEFLRNDERLTTLLPFCGPRTLLVLDESSFVKNASAQQTKACMTLRKACGRVVLLNGTPIFHSPLDLFSQGNLLSPSVLDCKFVSLFKARYAIQSPILERGKPMVRYGKVVKEVTGWTNLDDLERRFAPVTVRRLQKDCLDLPPKLDPVTLTATLTPATWKAYKQMRDDLVVWLEGGEGTSGRVATAATAAIKTLRLSQVTGGFLAGVEDAGIEEANNDRGRLYAGEEGFPGLGHADGADADAAPDDSRDAGGYSRGVVHQIEVGREKLEVLLWFIEQRLEADPNLHLVAWTRFRAELFRMVTVVRQKFPQFQTGAIHGGQKKEERLAALALLKPETSPEGPVFVGGIEGTGSFGLDMTAAHTCVTMSSGYSPGRSAQTLDRVYGPGQKHPIAYFEVVAVGPKGQKTIDHDILVARRSGEDVARRTAAAWVKALTEE